MTQPTLNLLQKVRVLVRTRCADEWNSRWVLGTVQEILGEKVNFGVLFDASNQVTFQDENTRFAVALAKPAWPFSGGEVVTAGIHSVKPAECEYCGAESCYCCPECGENVLLGHLINCTLDPEKK